MCAFCSVDVYSDGKLLNICPCLSVGHDAVTVEESAHGMLLQYLWIWL